jgi:hypothetical protein
MRRGQLREPGAFSYWRSGLVMFSLVAGLMLFWGTPAGPRTGDFADPKAAALGFVTGLAILPIVFYEDYRTQAKGRAECPRSTRRGNNARASDLCATGPDVAAD